MRHVPSYLIRICKWTLITLLVLGLVLVGSILFLNSNSGQSFVRKQAEAYLNRKFGTAVKIGGLQYDISKGIVLRDVELLDKRQRSLLKFGLLDVNIDIWALVGRHVDIRKIIFQHAAINLYRDSSSPAYNFDFIPAAFSSGTDTDTTGKGGSSFRISIGQVDLQDVKFLMDDGYGEQKYAIGIGTLNADLRGSNIEKLAFRVSSFSADNISSDIGFSGPGKNIEPVDTSSSSSSLRVSVDTVMVSATTFNLHDDPSSVQIETKIPQILGGRLEYSMETFNLKARSLVVKNHSSLVRFRSGQDQIDSKKSNSPSKPFRFSVDSVAFVNNKVSVDDESYPSSKKSKGFDPNHIGISNLDIYVSKLSFDGQTYRAKLRQLSGVESGGLSIKSLKADLRYSDSLIAADSLYLRTGLNEVRMNARMARGQTTGRSGFSINGNIATRNFKLSEIASIQPSLLENKYFRPLASKQIDLNSDFSGNSSLLRINKLDLREQGVRLNATALVYNVDIPDQLKIDLLLNEYSSTRSDLLALLPPGTIPDSVLHYIPSNFTFKGTFKGSQKEFRTDMKLFSPLGNAQVKGSMANPANKLRSKYALDINANSLDLGSILADTSMGKFTGAIHINGRGYDPASAVTSFNADIDQFTFRGYDYEQVKVDGSLNNGFLEAGFSSQDENLLASGEIRTTFTGPEKNLQTKIDVGRIDLGKLGFVDSALTWSGNIDADIPLLSEEKVLGNVYVTNNMLDWKGKLIHLDSISLVATHLLDSQQVYLKTPFLNASLVGRYQLQDLPTSVKKIFNKYAIMNSTDTQFTKLSQALLVIEANIPDSVAQLADGIKSISPFKAGASINTSDFQLIFTGYLPRVQYKDFTIDSLGLFSLTSKAGPHKELLVGVYIQELMSGSYALQGTNGSFRILNGVVDGNILFEDEKHRPRYSIPFQFTNDPKRPFIHINDSLLLNRKKWDVSKENRIYINVRDLTGSELSITNGRSQLRLNAGGTAAPGTPLNLELKDFNLADITDILIADTSLATGLLNARVSLASFSPLQFNGDLTADSLSVMGAQLGQLQAEVVNKDSSYLAIRSTLSGQNGEVKLNGDYRIATQTSNLTLGLNDLQLAMVQPFVRPYLSSISGHLDGQLLVRGNITEPFVDGEIKADSLEAVYSQTGTYVKMPKAGISFRGQQMIFEGVSFSDSAGNVATMTGNLELDRWRDAKLSLAVKGENFEVVGRRRSPEQQIFGPTRADLNLSINGTLEKLQVEGRINIRDSSDFTYVYTSEANDQIGEGLVEFFNPLTAVDSQQVSKSKRKTKLMMDMNLYVGITPKSTITIITDEMSGDHLKAKGKADLNVLMKPGSGPQLLGAYRLEGGEYSLSLAGIVRKSFQIEPGSTINWSGDPLKGNMDITAKYVTRTAAGPLLNDINHVQGIDKQKLQFNVMILLKKELLKPDIAFRLDMPETEQQAFGGIVYSRIRQVNVIPAELNKQVMGLLAFDQFIAENPFNSLTSAGGDFQTQAFNTAGKLLTQELTNLVGRYVKDVNIDFGLEMGSDYTGGKEVKKTDLKVGLSKSFANNRLNVYVGSNFTLEGSNQNRDALEGLAGDVTMEYLLTPDGKYRLKGYRLTDNELVFQGNVVRTGVSFVIVLEFNRFRNMFRSGKKKKKQTPDAAA